MKIYVASSWRNRAMHSAIVHICRAAKAEVYDFTAEEGFNWKEVDDHWQSWSFEQYKDGLISEPAERGFKRDYQAMQWADRFILVNPCGRSAHLELGWAIGMGKETAIFCPSTEPFEPELMYKLADLVTDSTMDLLAWLGVED